MSDTWPSEFVREVAQRLHIGVEKVGHTWVFRPPNSRFLFMFATNDGAMIFLTGYTEGHFHGLTAQDDKLQIDYEHVFSE